MNTLDTTTKDVTVRLTAIGHKGWERQAPWSATLGALTGYGKTATAAADDLAWKIGALALAASTEPIVIMYGGYVSVATLGAEGWTIVTYGPDGRQGGTTGRGGSRVSVEAAERFSLAQRVTDWQSDESVRAGAVFCLPDDATELQTRGPSEFLRYAGWQRAAAVAMAEQRADWHEWASAHVDEYVPAVA